MSKGIVPLVSQSVTPSKKHIAELSSLSAPTRLMPLWYKQQYPAIEAGEFKLAHDRFLIIVDDIYHIGKERARALNTDYRHFFI